MSIPAVGDSRPVLYLDVDGVLNIVGGAGEWPDFAPHRVTLRPGATYTLLLSSLMGAALAALPVEIRWATTWAEIANEKLSSLIGLPADLAVVCRPAVSNSPFKYQAVRTQVESERRPFVWIDDEAINRIADHWLAACEVPHLVIKPNPFNGITPGHIEQIRAWLGTLRP